MLGVKGEWLDSQEVRVEGVLTLVGAYQPWWKAFLHLRSGQIWPNLPTSGHLSVPYYRRTGQPLFNA
jgi:hypothetical protein